MPNNKLRNLGIADSAIVDIRDSSKCSTPFIDYVKLMLKELNVSFKDEGTCAEINCSSICPPEVSIVYTPETKILCITVGDTEICEELDVSTIVYTEACNGILPSGTGTVLDPLSYCLVIDPDECNLLTLSEDGLKASINTTSSFSEGILTIGIGCAEDIIADLNNLYDFNNGLQRIGSQVQLGGLPLLHNTIIPGAFNLSLTQGQFAIGHNAPLFPLHVRGTILSETSGSHNSIISKSYNNGGAFNASVTTYTSRGALGTEDYLDNDDVVGEFNFRPGLFSNALPWNGRGPAPGLIAYATENHSNGGYGTEISLRVIPNTEVEELIALTALNSGDLQFPLYSNTRDDSGDFAPENFFYPDSNGNVLVAPLSTISDALLASVVARNGVGIVGGYIELGGDSFPLLHETLLQQDDNNFYIYNNAEHYVYFGTESTIIYHDSGTNPEDIASTLFVRDGVAVFSEATIAQRALNGFYDNAQVGTSNGSAFMGTWIPDTFDQLLFPAPAEIPLKTAYIKVFQNEDEEGQIWLRGKNQLVTGDQLSLDIMAVLKNTSGTTIPSVVSGNVTPVAGALIYDASYKAGMIYDGATWQAINKRFPRVTPAEKAALAPLVGGEIVYVYDSATTTATFQGYNHYTGTWVTLA